MVQLGFMNAQYCFTAVDVGAYGKHSNRESFSDSELGHQLADGLLDMPKACVLPGLDVVTPHVIVTDEAFPLKRYLMWRYSGK